MQKQKASGRSRSGLKILRVARDYKNKKRLEKEARINELKNIDILAELEKDRLPIDEEKLLSFGRMIMEDLDDDQNVE